MYSDETRVRTIQGERADQEASFDRMDVEGLESHTWV
jgi:hypothetical protein